MSSRIRRAFASLTPTDNRIRIWCSVAVLAFVVRLAAAVATNSLQHPRVYEYDTLARSLLAGRGFAVRHLHINYYSFVTPLHAWISAASYWLTGTTVPLMLAQIAAGSALAVIVASIAGRIFSGWIAAASAGVLIAFHPGLVAYSATKAHPLVFDALFCTLALLQSFRLAERPTIRRAVEFGLILGVGALSRGTIVIFGPIAGLWLLVMAVRESRTLVFRNLIIAGLLTVGIIAPWTLRCSLLHHRFVFLLTTDSEDFWIGNNPYATGHAYVDPGHLVVTALPSDELADLLGQPTETAQADWFASRSHAFIRAHPAEFLRLTFLKFFHFWWYAPQTGVEYRARWFYLYMTYYIGALILAGFGVWRVVRSGPPATHLVWLLGIFLFGLSALQSLYFVEGRHRWAVESMLIVLSGGGIALMLEKTFKAKPSGPHQGTPAL